MPAESIVLLSLRGRKITKENSLPTCEVEVLLDRGVQSSDLNAFIDQAFVTLIAAAQLK